MARLTGSDFPEVIDHGETDKEKSTFKRYCINELTVFAIKGNLIRKCQSQNSCFPVYF